MDLLIGVLAFLLIFVITSYLHLPILYTLMTNLANVAAIAILIIFQPELRVALSKLSLRGKRYREVTEFDKFIDQFIGSIYRLAGKRIGALIALEHEDRLDEFAQNAVGLNARFTPELLETIFAPSTPLHDGAVIIRDMTIVAAAVILPLADDVSETLKSMGTRHRAAYGLSKQSDALVIVVSEQTGNVSVARDGVITTQPVKENQLSGIIRSRINQITKTTLPRSKFNLRKMLGV